MQCTAAGNQSVYPRAFLIVKNKRHETTSLRRRRPASAAGMRSYDRERRRCLARTGR